jgi:KaiC/GvpD/RAD55 family RecA-like ATPase
VYDYGHAYIIILVRVVSIILAQSEMGAFSFENQDTLILWQTCLPVHLASTGIASLDQLLGSDGYPDRSTVLIVGPPGVGKELLIYKFMASGLALDDFCFYITKRSVREVLQDSKAFGFESELSKLSLWMASAGGQLKFNVDDLASLSFTIKDTLRNKTGKKIRIAVDALSSLLMLNSAETIYKFLSQLFSELKEYDIVLLATLEEGMHPAQVFSAMGELFDGVVELKLFEEGMKIIPIFRIKKMRGLPPQPTYYNFTYSRTVGLEVSPYVR